MVLFNYYMSKPHIDLLDLILFAVLVKTLLYFYGLQAKEKPQWIQNLVKVAV